MENKGFKTISNNRGESESGFLLGFYLATSVVVLRGVCAPSVPSSDQRPTRDSEVVIASPPLQA